MWNVNSTRTHLQNFTYTKSIDKYIFLIFCTERERKWSNMPFALFPGPIKEISAHAIFSRAADFS